MYGDIFLDTTQKAPFLKEITDRLGFTQIKNFHSAKDSVKTTKGTLGENICKRHLKKSYSEYANNLKHNNKSTT